MSNHDNQNQSNERKIYLKDLHQWVRVSKTDYDNYYRDIKPIAAGNRSTAAVSAQQTSATSAIWTAGPAVFTRPVMNFPLITP